MEINTRKISSGCHCAVIGCYNNQKRLNAMLDMECYDHKPLIRRVCSCLRPFSFYCPKQEDERREWLSKLRLKKPPKKLLVCSFHFIDRRPTAENPLPQLFLGYESKVKTRRILTRNDIPSSLKPRQTQATEESTSGSSRRKKNASFSANDSLRESATGPAVLTPGSEPQLADPNPTDLADFNESATGPAVLTPGSEPQLADPNPTDLADSNDVPSPAGSDKTTPGSCCTPVNRLLSMTDQGTQWEDVSLQDHLYSLRTPTKRRTCDKALQCSPDEETVSNRFLKSNSDSRLYTGIDLHAFVLLVQCMEPFADESITLAVTDQILLTLMKLKLHLLLEDLARRFGISKGFVSRIIRIWIDILAEHLYKLIVFLPREYIRATMPTCFKNFPDTTCIMDCAETILQKPSNLRSRAEVYSNYKSHNTVKYCVTIAPCGYIMHISGAYGGRCSDRFIVQDSGVLDNLLPGDVVMADRGFTIQDLLFPMKVGLNMPAFSHGKQLSEEDVTRTRRIASVRIHVERVIRKMKVFRILRETVPIVLTDKVDQILRIVAALVNLDSEVIREKKS